MKKTLLTLLMLLVQIGNCNLVDNKMPISQSAVESPYHQSFSKDTETEHKAPINESTWEAEQSDEAQGSVVGKVAKVFGFTLLGLVGACAALAVYVVSMGGVGRC